MEYIGKIFAPSGELKKGIVVTDNGKITDIRYDENVNGEKIIIPGLIDIHLHGAHGYDICDGTIEAFERIAEYEMANGIVAFCGATMTIPAGDINTIMDAASEYKNVVGCNKSAFQGIYLEGPFISKEYCGAQRKDCVIKSDKELLSDWITKSGNSIRFAVVAPEEMESDFIKYINSLGIKVCIGHSAADYNEAIKAFNSGATQVTHLYNAMKDSVKRSPNIPGAAFDSGAFVELIADGNHVSDTFLRMAFKIYDEDKIILISDSMRATGLEDGESSLGGQKVFAKTVSDNKRVATLSNGTLAGSVSNLHDCVKNAISMGVPFSKVVNAATINPARRLGIDNLYGTIEIGKAAPIYLNKLFKC